MKRRCPSAKTTSNASEDLPEPLGPVTTQSLPCGIDARHVLQVVLARVRRPRSHGGSRRESASRRSRRPAPASASRAANLAQRDAGPRVALRDLLGRALRDDARRRAGPPPGPRSMTQSHARMTSRSCSTTTTLAPSLDERVQRVDDVAPRPARGGRRSARRRRRASPSPARESARASLRRCASPPESVESGCPSAR